MPLSLSRSIYVYPTWTNNNGAGATSWAADVRVSGTFTVTEPVTITALGWKTTISNPVFPLIIGLFDNTTKALITRGNITATVKTFSFSPITLIPGITYYVVALIPAGESYSNVAVPLPFTGDLAGKVIPGGGFKDTTASLDIPAGGSLGTGWMGDFILTFRTISSESTSIPWEPAVEAGDGSFAVQLPIEWLPTLWTEWELQYSTSIDNSTWGEWKDVETIQYPTTEFTMTDLDKNELPFYRFRYRLHTQSNKTDWSEAGQGGIAVNLINAVDIEGQIDGTSQVIPGSVTGGSIASGTITGSLISAGTITAGNILAGTITATQIATGTITAAQIATNTLTANEIAANAITTSELNASAVTATKIAADTITANEIAANAITTSELSAGSVTAAKIVADTITANEIAANAITTSELNASAVTAAKIAADTITANEIAANAITTSELNAGAVTAAKITADTITANEIAANAITATEIAADAVTATKIKAGEVIAGKIAANAVTAVEIASASINSSHIVNGSILTTDLTATAIDGMTITGSKIQTASSGARVVIDTTGIQAYNGSGISQLGFDVSTGNLTITGTLTQGSVVPANTVSGWQPRLNQCTNPTFETGTAGWDAVGSFWINGGSTITQSATQAFDGTSSMKVVTPGAANFEGIRYVGATVTSGVKATASGYMYGNAGGETVAIGFGDATVGQVSTNITLTKGWQRVSATLTPTASGTTTVALKTNGKQAITFFVDAVLIETSATLNPYFPTIAQLASNQAAWMGVANASISKYVEFGVQNVTELVGQITVTQISDNSISTPKLQANSVTSNEILGGSIVAADISATAGITGNQIAGNTITANNIVSGTISTDLLTVGVGGVGVNLFVGGDAEQGAGVLKLVESSLAGTLGISTTEYASGGQSFSMTSPTGTALGGWGMTNAVPVTPGKTYTFKAKVKGSASSISGLYYRVNEWKTQPAATETSATRTSLTDLISNAAVPAAWTAYEFAYTPATGVRWVVPSIYNWGSSVTLYVDEWEFRAPLSNFATVLTPSSISTEMLKATAIDAMTITGATFRTAASNPRVVLNSTGLSSIDSGGVTTVSLTGAGGLNLELGTTPTPPDNRSIIWNQSGTSYIKLNAWKTGSPGTVALSQSAVSYNKADSTLLNIASSHDFSKASAGVQFQANDASGLAYVTASNGGTGESRLLLDGAGSSQYIQYNPLGTAAKISDYGIVTGLPVTGLTVGSRCIFDTGTAGVMWWLIYDGVGTYPWKKIGGPPLYAASNVTRSLTNQLTYASLPTDPLTIVAPLAGDYLMTIECTLTTPANTQSGFLSYAIGATAANDNWCLGQLTNAGGALVNPDSLTTLQTGVAASASIIEKGKSGGNYVITYDRRRLRIDPVRVG